jgi:hypothetical protein
MIGYQGIKNMPENEFDELSQEKDDDFISQLAKNHKSMANAIYYMLMRINRIEDRLNIFNDKDGK